LDVGRSAPRSGTTNCECRPKYERRLRRAKRPKTDYEPIFIEHPIRSPVEWCLGIQRRQNAEKDPLANFAEPAICPPPLAARWLPVNKHPFSR
jgi:hypothetical protein